MKTSTSPITTASRNETNISTVKTTTDSSIWATAIAAATLNWRPSMPSRHRRDAAICPAKTAATATGSQQATATATSSTWVDQPDPDEQAGGAEDDEGERVGAAHGWKR